MASLRFVRDSIAEAKGQILVLMQEGEAYQWEEEGGAVSFVNQEWADSMYNAWHLLGLAEKQLDEAENYA